MYIYQKCYNSSLLSSFKKFQKFLSLVLLVKFYFGAILIARYTELLRYSLYLYFYTNLNISRLNWLPLISPICHSFKNVGCAGIITKFKLKK